MFYKESNASRYKKEFTAEDSLFPKDEGGMSNHIIINNINWENDFEKHKPKSKVTKRNIR